MNVLMLWDYYPRYLSWFYERNALKDLSFEEHKARLLGDHFGWPAELCGYMRSHGIDAGFLVSNDERLQRKWAGEQGFTVAEDSEWQDEISLAQIRRIRPDVLWVSLHLHRYGRFVAEAAKYAGKTIAWVGSPFDREIDVTGISVLLTENPRTLHSKQRNFEKVIVTRPGFDSAILENLSLSGKKHDITVPGSISGSHTKRAETISHLVRQGVALNVVGSMDDEPRPRGIRGLRLAAWHVARRGNLRAGAETLRRTFAPSAYERHIETIRSVCHPPVFGLAMYREIAESRIVVNTHIDVAGGHAGNMRMFETTGVGSCLVTEDASNISQLFEPGNEILTYRTKEELVEVLEAAVRDRDGTERIARAGHERTLRDHTLANMFNDIRPALS